MIRCSKPRITSSNLDNNFKSRDLQMGPAQDSLVCKKDGAKSRTMKRFTGAIHLSCEKKHRGIVYPFLPSVLLQYRRTGLSFFPVMSAGKTGL